MGRPEAIFLDVDGTLISFTSHRVPQSAIDALCEMHRAGVRIIIATGRTHTDLADLEAIPYDAVVALNGAECVLRDGTPIVRRPISLSDFHRIRRFAHDYDFPVAVETPNGILVDRVTPIVVELSQLTNHPIPPIVDIEREFIETNCCQVCIYCSEEVEAEMMRQLPGLTVSRWNPCFADVNIAGVDKSVGISDIAQYYGFDTRATMAIGDGGNDIPMLKAAGIGVAMGNASPRVKDSADYVTTSVDDDGIRHALRHFGFIE